MDMFWKKVKKRTTPANRINKNWEDVSRLKNWEFQYTSSHKNKAEDKKKTDWSLGPGKYLIKDGKITRTTHPCSSFSSCFDGLNSSGEHGSAISGGCGGLVMTMSGPDANRDYLVQLLSEIDMKIEILQFQRQQLVKEMFACEENKRKNKVGGTVEHGADEGDTWRKCSHMMVTCMEESVDMEGSPLFYNVECDHPEMMDDIYADIDL